MQCLDSDPAKRPSISCAYERIDTLVGELFIYSWCYIIYSVKDSVTGHGIVGSQ